MEAEEHKLERPLELAKPYEEKVRENDPLQQACHEGNIEQVKKLAHGQDLTVPILIAAQQGHLSLVKELLALGANIEAATWDYRPGVRTEHAIGGRTPLYLAAQNGHLDIVKYLVQIGADIDVLAAFQTTPLFVAAQEGHLEVVKFLLERGAAVDYANNRGCTPFGVACCAGHMDVIKVLFRAPGRFPYLERSYTNIAFIYAAKNGQSEVIKFLLENNAIVDKELETKQRALVAAVQQRRAGVVRQLMLLGVHPSFPYIEPDNNKKAKPRTVWQVILNDKSMCAAVPAWSPQTHKIYPVCTREAITCVLLIAKRQHWPFDQQLLFKIIALVAFGWYQDYNNKIGTKGTDNTPSSKDKATRSCSIS